MKYTDKTATIGRLVTSKPFKRDIIFACAQCIDVSTLTETADQIAQGNTVTSKVWETARERRGKVKHHNRRIITARDNIRDVLELTARAVGTTLSVVKHALETRHEPTVMRLFKIDMGPLDINAEVERLKKDGVSVIFSNDRHYKQMPVKLDLDVLCATLHEQCRSHYGAKQ